MVECIDGLVSGPKFVWMDGWTDGWLLRWMNEWKAGCINVWLDG
jgi:hypothetical protein